MVEHSKKYSGRVYIQVHLKTKPTGLVVVTWASSNPNFRATSGPWLFDQRNWQTPQRIEYSWDDDPDLIDDTVILSLTASGGGYDGVSESVTFTIFEEDLLVVGNSIYLHEGASESSTVRLSARPSENVTVTVRPNASFNRLNATFDTDADTPGNQHTLTFTPTNWRIGQQVTVSAAADAFAALPPNFEHATLSVILPNDAYKLIYIYPLKANPYARSFSVSPNVLTLDEGSSKTITVRMLSPPLSRVTLIGANNGLGAVTIKNSVTFTPSNWNTPQMMTVRAHEDDDASDEEGYYNQTSLSSFFYYFVRDNDAGLNVSTKYLDVPEGGSAMFTVRLNSRPSGTVTVNVPNPSRTDLTVDTDPLASGSQNTLTFTTDNWSTPQTVTMMADDDDEVRGGYEYVSLTVSGSDTDYAGQTARVRVNVDDNDYYPIIEMASDPLIVPEGDSNTFTVRMSAPQNYERIVIQEFANKDVAIDTDADTPGNQKSLTFNSDNWNIPQTVTVRAAIDADRLSETQQLRFDRYNRYVSILVADDDLSGLRLSTTHLSIPEGGSKTFTVVLALTRQLSGDMTVRLAQEGKANSDVTLDKSSLTFTRGNWNIPQTVTVSASQDHDAIDDSTAISLTASGGGHENLSLRMRRVVVTVDDDDEAGLTLSSDDLTIPEGGSETFNVQLATQPSRNVTVTLTQPRNPDVTVDTDTATTGNQRTLTFTTSNWNQDQTVTVSTLRDDDTLDDRASIALTASGADYGDVTGSLPVLVTERSAAGLILSTRSVGVYEGGSGRFTVRLKTQPRTDVTLTLAQPRNTDVTVDTDANTAGSQNKLTFTESNWSTEQTVMVHAAHDDDAVNDRATISLTASGDDYGGVAGDMSATVTDDDSPGLIVSPTAVAVDADGLATFSVQLAAKPGNNRTVALASNSDDVAVDQTSLTFTTSNWNTAQTVTVSAAHDGESASYSARVTLTASGGGYVNETETVTVNVTDHGLIGLRLSPSSLNISEGGSDTFTVKLAAQPSADVTVTLAQPGNTDVTVDIDTVAAGNQNTLTFTPANWSAPQTVTVNTVKDTDTADDTATISLTGDGIAKAWATVNVREVIQARRNENILIIEEGESDTFSYVLRSRPSSDRTLTMRTTDADVTLSTGGGASSQTLTLTFTPDNWSTAQSVTVSVAEDYTDARDSDEYIDFTLDVGLVHEDGVDQRLQVGLLDDDIGLTLAPTLLTLAEGRSGTFTVKPSSEIKRVRKVTLESNSDDVTLSPSSLTFHSNTAAQTVTVTAADDADGADDTATISLTGNPLAPASLTVTVTDNDRGLILSTSSLGISEGEKKTFKVQLAVQPSATVTVTLSRGGSTDVSFDADAGEGGDQNKLTFTTSNWNQAQTVTVGAAEDDDATDDSATISLSASGGDYDDVTGSVAVTVTDDDVGLEVSVTSLTVDEGGNGTFTVRLAAQPPGNVTVTLTPPENTDVTIADTDPATAGDQTALEFTPENWSAAQTVTVRAAADNDAITDSATVAIQAGDGDYSGERRSVTVSVTEKHTVGLTITADEKPLEVDEGGSSTFSVKLTSEPSDNVTVNLSRSGSADVSLGANADNSGSQTSLSFTASNWSAAQTVTVRAADDDDAADERATISLSASGGDYRDVAGSLSVAVTDDDSPGLTLTPATLNVGEGDRNTFEVQLATQPSDDVTVTLSLSGAANSDVKFATNAITFGDRGRLTFTASNWNQARTVTVRAGEDGDAADDAATISLSASGGDYDDVSESLRVTVKDDDVGLEVSTTTLTVAEGGLATFTVRLKAAPNVDMPVILWQRGAANADVSFDIDPEKGGDQSRLTFTVDNWSAVRTVTVRAAEDPDAIPDTATLTVQAGGDGEHADARKIVTVHVTENETAGLTITPAVLSVSEGGSGSFEVRLSSAPSDDVTVNLSRTGSTDVSFDTDPDNGGDQTSLDFTASSWSTAQRVTVRAIQDADATDDSATISLSASGGDYEGKAGSVSVTVDDDDKPALVLSTNSLGVTEEDGNTFAVRLATRPSGDVTVALRQDENTANDEVTLDKESLTFTASSWSTEQTVRVSAAQDDDTDNDSATIRLTASGGGYAGVTGEVAVTVTDNDTPGLSLSPTSLTVAEGGSDAFDVRLTTRPSGAVTVALGQDEDAANNDVTVDETELTFTADNWNIEQTVTVSAAEDDDAVNDRAIIELTASGGGYAGVTGSVEVAVKDIDEARLTITADAPFEVDEGGDETFRVRLASKPSANVTVNIAQAGTTNSDVTATPASLIFTVDNWDEDQEVAVRAIQDDDAVKDSATIRLTASDGGYDDATGEVSVTVRDDDEAGLVTMPSDPYRVVEGRKITFEVRLATAPAADVTVTLAQPANTDVTVDVDPDTAGNQTKLTFTALNWGAPQTVTVSAAHDSNANSESASITLSASGGDYGDVSRSVSVNVTDDDVGLAVSATELDVDEGSYTTFTVQLAAAPPNDVTVTLRQPDNTDVTVDETSLTFSASSWSTARMVTVSAAHDSDAINESATIELVAGDGNYAGGRASITVNVDDDDTPGLDITAADPFEVTEGGEKTFTVQLVTQPSGEVTVELAQDENTVNTDVTLDKNSLSFTVDNWDEEQTVTVSAAEDDDILDENATINLTAAGGDYEGKAGSVEVTVDDNDEATLVITPTTLTVDEENSNIFTVKLGIRPASDVTLTLAQDEDPTNTDVTLDKTALMFTADSWGTP
ncbi:MAG: hypothetical protein ISN29_07900, partial [Gammaproteobacteria bacterium AqS3]|nr:hypothetical protein [Gammaproteobacteria bacterium AqS3]